MIEALRPIYEGALKFAEWSLEKFSDVDELVHTGKAEVLAAIDKLRAELGLPALARGGELPAAAVASAETFVASLGQ